MIVRRSLYLAIVGIAVLGSGCTLAAQAGTASGSFERTLDVDGPVELDVRTGSGAIQVRSGPAGEVRLVGHVRARSGLWSALDPEERVKAIVANPPIVQERNSIRIGEITNAALREQVSISYELTVPTDTRITARTGSGSHSIESIQGPVEAHTGSGGIRVSQIDGRVTATSGSGSIEVRGAGEGLTAKTGSGSIRAEGIGGRVEASTGSGRVDVAHAGGQADISTGSGGIRVTGARDRMRVRAGSGSITVEGDPSADWVIGTGSGGVNVRVPAGAAFSLDARTSSGSIHAEHPIDLQGSASRGRLQGQVRGGGPRIDVSTSSGSIRVE